MFRCIQLMYLISHEHTHTRSTLWNTVTPAHLTQLSKQIAYFSFFYKSPGLKVHQRSDNQSTPFFKCLQHLTFVSVKNHFMYLSIACQHMHTACWRILHDMFKSLAAVLWRNQSIHCVQLTTCFLLNRSQLKVQIQQLRMKMWKVWLNHNWIILT
jgi:hypothetical protein